MINKNISLSFFISFSSKKNLYFNLWNNSYCAWILFSVRIILKFNLERLIILLMLSDKVSQVSSSSDGSFFVDVNFNRTIRSLCSLFHSPTNCKIVESRCNPSTTLHSALCCCATKIGGKGIPKIINSINFYLCSSSQRKSLC